MNKIAIIILNYLNYMDTIECIESIEQMKYDLAGIVIVDNDSPNESYQVLKQKYVHNDLVHVIRTRKNYGFAKGNNIGIHYARKSFGTNYIFTVNNDVIFKDKSFFEILLKEYDEKTAIIGPVVHSPKGIDKPFEIWVDFPNVLRELMKHKLLCMGKYSLANAVFSGNAASRTQILHGCGLLFTPIYFKYYKGFFSGTFLYGEEIVLYIRCKLKGLKQKYVKDTYIYHKESVSSEISFNKDSAVIAKHTYNSYKYVIWYSLLYSVWKKVNGINKNEKSVV